MRIALIGQPNCGKSTLFNQVAGYKAETGNFSGTTVEYTSSNVRVLGDVIELVDLPGTYSLSGANPAESVVFEYLATHSVDGIINVMDASHLSYSLELTIELLELQCPMVVALNMIDEATRLGMKIDVKELSHELGVPVLPMIASRGRGIRDVFVQALHEAEGKRIPDRIMLSNDIEAYIQQLNPFLEKNKGPLSSELLGIKLIEGDERYLKKLGFDADSDTSLALIKIHEDIFNKKGQDPVWVLSGERHTIATKIANKIFVQEEHEIKLRDKIDDVLLHPFWGYLTLGIILLLFFQFVYHFGTILEEPLLGLFDLLTNQITNRYGNGLIPQLLDGLFQGVAGGVAIVLPYLIPFLIGLGLLEDIGYLPRVAFLMDALMHRMGLHGKAVVPFILGYGCNVPAVMSTRIMEDKRDQYIAAALATLIPCAARLSVVFGLVAFYLGPNLALAIYLFNILVIGITAKILSNLLPEKTPGLILEIPAYRLPTIRTLTSKVWFRIREFVIEAWPVLIIGSMVLSFLNYFNMAAVVNYTVRPLSWLLGLPKEVGVPLIFGILRKELTLVMLRQALNTSDISLVLSSVQMITFAVFVVFYVPCLATLVVLRKELGTKMMLSIALMTVLIATIAALFARVVSLLLL